MTIRNEDDEKKSLRIPTVVYAARLKSKTALLQSSSGGAFIALSDNFILNGDAVVCAAYNYETHTTEFSIVTTKEERDAARGSKYMQSKPNDIFNNSVKWLHENPSKRLLFVGMGCQAEGFRKFAEASEIRDRVVIVDIICHGSPSPMLWREYAAMLENKYSGKLQELSFKDKRNGWLKPTARTIISGKEIFLHDYVKVFYNRCALRPSCHICPFATTERSIDITLGDFWHIENTMPEFFDENGTSLLLIHTIRGKELFDSIKDSLEYRLSNTRDCWQANLERPTPISENREHFWEEYRNRGIEYIMKHYGKDSLQTKIKRKIKKIIRGGGYSQLTVSLGSYSERRAA